MNFKRILALIKKEFLAIFLDPKSRFFLIFPPLLQLFIFTFAATLDVKNISMGILNRDSGSRSFELIQRVRGSPMVKSIVEYDNEKELREAINSQKVLLALSFDEAFSRSIEKKEPATVQIIVDGRKSNSGQIAAGYMTKIIDRYNRDIQIGMVPKQPEISLIAFSWFNPNHIYPWFTLTGLVGVLVTMTTVSTTALSVARERELGTFDQLLVTPLTSWEILMGKCIPAIIIGLVEGSMMLTAGHFFFDVPVMGTLLGLYLCMFIFVISIVGVGMFISSISQTQQQATLGIFVFMVPGVILSGYATPVEYMPEWLQWIASIDPLKYFISIVRGVCFKDVPWNFILKNLYPMVLIAMATLSTSVYLFKSKVAS